MGDKLGTICMYPDEIHYLIVCLCPEDSAQLVSGIFDRICLRHNALPLQTLIRLDVKCTLHYDLQTNGNITPVPLKQIQYQLDLTSKELNQTNEKLNKIKEGIVALTDKFACSDYPLPDNVNAMLKYLNSLIK